MRTRFVLLLCTLLAAGVGTAPGAVALFDGKTFAGWEGDTTNSWRIADGAIQAGSIDRKFPRNEFLCTTRPYTNFVLRLQVRLRGTEGFVNGGIQVRSQRIPNPPNEMSGYQADLGAGWWGALYDESRRNKMLAKPDPALAQKLVKPDDWNDYEIRCEGRRIRLTLNGTLTVDYTEPDTTLPQSGLIGLQIHGNGKTAIAYRAITLEELP
ncbi:MAG: hypothetical protein RJA22_455 [Verrucomicrobiota bacterium]